MKQYIKKYLLLEKKHPDLIVLSNIVEGNSNVFSAYLQWLYTRKFGILFRCI